LTERLTIDATLARDYLDPERKRHALAAELFDLARRGEVELSTAPQGYRLDVSGDLGEQVREAFDREDVPQARQIARVSEVTFPGEDLIVGHGRGLRRGLGRDRGGLAECTWTG
jgi:hypothetical protein